MVCWSQMDNTFDGIVLVVACHICGDDQLQVVRKMTSNLASMQVLLMDRGQNQPPVTTRTHWSTGAYFCHLQFLKVQNLRTFFPILTQLIGLASPYQSSTFDDLALRPSVD